MTVGLDSNGVIAVVGIIITLWTISMGGAWKVATILSKVSGELQYLQAQNEDKRQLIQIAITQGEDNAANIATIQKHLNIPQADTHGR